MNQLLTGLAQPLWLLALVPLLALGWNLLRRQRRAVAWLEERTHERHTWQWTRHTRRSLGRHLALLLLAGASLVVAASAPFGTGEVEVQSEQRTVLLLIDASLSMGAPDVVVAAEEDAISRLAHAGRIARRLVESQPAARFGLITFSGAAIVHSPPTRDHIGLMSLLDALRPHIDNDTSGTRFSTGFEAGAALLADVDGAVDIVLISDGELPEPDAFERDLAALEARGVAIHAVAVGSPEPTSMRQWDMARIYAGEERQEVGTYSTQRVDEHLRSIAERTNAAFLAPSPGDALDPIVGSLSSSARGQGVGEQGRRSAAWVFVTLFLILFVHELLWLGDRSKSRWVDGRSPPENDPGPWTRSSSPKRPVAATLAVAPFLLLAECPEPMGGVFRVLGALTTTELGRGYAAEGTETGDVAAKLAFRQAIALGWRQHISWTNLATVELTAGELDAAHRHLEQALRQRPNHRPALFNDAWALYLWGERELDLESCDFERTRILWQQATGRLDSAGRAALPWTEAARLRAAARSNRAQLEQRIQELDEHDEEFCTPPEPPPSEPPPPDGGTGGGGSSDDESDSSESDSRSGESGGGGSEGGGGGGESASSAEAEGGDGTDDGDPENQDPKGGSGGGSGQKDPEKGKGEGQPERGEGPPEPAGGQGGAGGGSGEPESGDGEGAGGGSSGESGGGGGLSDGDREQIAAALERIRGEAKGASGYHQSGASQLGPDMAERARGKKRKW